MSKYAKTPYQNGFAKIAYNVFMALDNPWLTVDEVWDLMPGSAQRKHHSRVKLTRALKNGLRTGLFVILKKDDSEKFAVASLSHQQNMRNTWSEKNKKWRQSKAKEKAVSKRTNGATDHTKAVDIGSLDREIEIMQSRLDAMRQIRELASEL